ncbi:MAG TPA: hypothetical protein VHD55_02075 [Candidatus Paceibacterota bacterium]|nr:hypothetical protein [Candidatus Paceibacterota bacterium]
MAKFVIRYVVFFKSLSNRGRTNLRPGKSVRPVAATFDASDLEAGKIEAARRWGELKQKWGDEIEFRNLEQVALVDWRPQG